MADENNNLTVEEVVKKLDELDLPTSIQGDGRYVLELIEAYLKELSSTINTMNGYEEEEEIIENNVPTARNFRISFPNGVYTAQWSRAIFTTSDTLKTYELRTNQNAGERAGLLDLTTELTSLVNPTSRSATVYLYTQSNKDEYSNPNFATYNKPVPNAPLSLNITPSENGQLINFTQIPSDCIGAKIIINGNETVLTTNQFLYTESFPINELKICYYDCFGDGRFLSAFSFIDDVTDFIVERVGDLLNFTWTPLQGSNLYYQVRRSDDLANASWESSEFVFDIAGNKNSIQFPNKGRFIFWIKAYDQFNNVSEVAQFYRINTEPIVWPNIIQKYDQMKLLWPGNKINMVYDEADEIMYMKENSSYAEYIQDVSLPEHDRNNKNDPYLARNWVDFSVFALEGDVSSTTWATADFPWDSDDGLSNWLGKTIDFPHVVSHSIATKTSTLPDNLIDFWEFENSLVGENGTQPASSSGTIQYKQGRYYGGISLDEDDYATWDLDLSNKDWTISFWIDKDSNDDNIISPIIRLQNDDNSSWHNLEYNRHTKKLTLSNSNGDIIVTAGEFQFRNRDTLLVGIASSQSGKLALYIYSTNTAYSFYKEIGSTYINNITEIKVGAYP